MTKLHGQIIFLGPTIPGLGLQHGMIFRDGIFDALYPWIDRCPALGGLFVPIELCATVRRELNMDLGRQVRGTQGKYVTFYREVQNWLKQQPQKTQTQTGVKVKTHA